MEQYLGLYEWLTDIIQRLNTKQRMGYQLKAGNSGNGRNQKSGARSQESEGMEGRGSSVNFEF